MASVNKTAVFVPSYCLAKGAKRLTSMSRQSVEKAAEFILQGRASDIILSTAYDTWQREFVLKKSILLECAIDPAKVHVVEEVTDSFDESRKLLWFINDLGLEKIILFAERWHAPRAEMIFRAMFPCLEIEVERFTTDLYEMAHEPHPIKFLGWLKSVRAGFASLWGLWNMLLQLLTPQMLRRRFMKE